MEEKEEEETAAMLSWSGEAYYGADMCESNVEKLVIILIVITMACLWKLQNEMVITFFGIDPLSLLLTRRSDDYHSDKK